MNTSDWGLDTERNPPKHALTGRERNYLLTGDTEPYGDSKYNEYVSEKADMLTDRIQDLIDDICLLYLNDYLEDSEGDHVFDASDLEFRTQLVRDEKIVRTSRESTESSSEFGFEIGGILSMLGVSSNPPDIVWGVLIGLVGHSEARFANERDVIYDILRQLENRHEERLFHAGTELALDDEDAFAALRATANNVFLENGITPVPALLDAVIQYQINPMTAPLDLDPDSYGMDTGQGEPPEKPSEQMDIDGWDTTNIRTLVQALLDETRVRELEDLRVDLRCDVRQINTRTQFGTKARDIFRNMPLYTSTDSFPKSTYSSKDMRTAVLHKLSGQEEYPLWTTRPVVEESGSSHWKLTSYGRLLHRTIFDHDGSADWIHQVLLSKNSLSEEDESLLTEVLNKWGV